MPPGPEDVVTLRHASFASGIGGFDLGFELAGMESVFQCEADKFCLSILERHWLDVPKHPDLRTLTSEEIPEADVWSTGFPCQDLSVAGRRKGLVHGERSNLWFDFAALVEQKRPAWVVIENVPRLLSSNGGADMALIVGQLSSIGYGVAWRVLDSQFFGVPQRRRRVYIVGHLGDLRAFEVLFEREGSGGDPTQDSGEVPSVADTLGTSADRISGRPGPLAYALTGRGPGERREAEAAYVIQDARGVRNKEQHGWGIQQGGPSYTLDGVSQHAVAIAENQHGELRTSQHSAKEGESPEEDTQPSPTPSKHPMGTTDTPAPEGTEGTTSSSRPSESAGERRAQGTIPTTPRLSVRRLTPRECERLQSFPDDWTVPVTALSATPSP